MQILLKNTKLLEEVCQALAPKRVDPELSRKRREAGRKGMQAVLAKRGRSDQPAQNPEATKAKIYAYSHRAAAKIIAEIPKHGRNWFETYDKNKYQNFDQAAEASLGKLAFRVVKIMGSWSKTCAYCDNSDPANAMSQLRDLAIGILEAQTNGN